MSGPTSARSSGDTIKTNGNTGIVAVAPGHVSTDNSTTDALIADGVFAGEWEDITNFGVIIISMASNVASATNGLVVQFSSDGTEAGIISDDEFSFSAGSKKTWSFQSAAKYYRVKYTNGITGQTSFNLQTVLKPYYVKPSSHRVQDQIIDDDDAELVKAVLTGQKPGGDFVNFQATTAGNFKTSIEELESGVSEDTNTSLRIANIIADEFGEVFRQLGDNIFQGAPVVVASEHHEIHCGDSYEATDNVTLGNGATRDYLIIVPDEGTVNGINTGVDQSVKLYHFLGKIESQSELSATFYESADRVAGTAINVFNRNRNSTLVDFLDISHTPTGGTTDGSIIWGPWRIGTGRAGEGAKGRESEFVLKNNTKYILKITNQTVSDNNVNVEFDYYVHPGV